ncbi:MAG: Recombinase [Candidatus Giovannonibacteria bacterium GW2011_GWC2_44_9]|uniref:Recombinase n=1 Tax=Candidatus Giovannonibacteria bacterium GW2011_GWC2_44_9 TaxID=1618658 RepID=A0A0G1MRM0_9BACT|nr:MAG: Recombinase [Candidatus Levybacteria bacterium GW2011_GWA1_39_32]KKT83442.1 MAG: Recombinase [Candidatus Giovannonibacteria bacterium GW2011_GWC2_44_9]
MNTAEAPTGTLARPIQAPIRVKYCLYARKSTESEERQVLSIDSQIKEMLELAEREGLEIVTMKRESHSAKETGQRPVFNEIVDEINEGKFNGILTWAPDRISRNAGDLGKIVDLMDAGKLHEIRTFGQRFTNSPSEKFLLMILGSQAKLENDNRGVNVRRGLRTRAEMGLWAGLAPLGYLNQYMMDKKCQVIVDPIRSPIIKQMFEKVAYEKWSGRKLYNWLRFELNFHTRGNKPMTLSSVYRTLDNPFYYGVFERPLGSGNWYTGKHTPLITKEIFDQTQAQLTRDKIVRETKEFAFTKLFTCGYCGSGISAEEKWKQLKGGGANRYIYYSCSRARDRNCKNKYIREEDLITELLKILDKVNINELGMRQKLEEEIARFNIFQRSVLGTKEKIQNNKETDIRNYAKYILKEGTTVEKRELLANLRSRIIYKDKMLTLVKE